MRVFTKLEHAGVALMVFGIGVGYYGCSSGHEGITVAVETYADTMGRAGHVRDITNTMSELTHSAAAAGRQFRLGYGGLWTFLLGIAVFSVAGRLRSVNTSDGEKDTAATEPATSGYRETGDG
jgi:hypothetical protein